MVALALSLETHANECESEIEAELIVLYMCVVLLRFRRGRKSWRKKRSEESQKESAHVASEA